MNAGFAVAPDSNMPPVPWSSIVFSGGAAPVAEAQAPANPTLKPEGTDTYEEVESTVMALYGKAYDAWFEKKWGAHSCAVPGCGWCMVFDGHLKVSVVLKISRGGEDGKAVSEQMQLSHHTHAGTADGVRFQVAKLGKCAGLPPQWLLPGVPPPTNSSQQGALHGRTVHAGP